MTARYLILTYWQVYGAMAVSALAMFWAGWGACSLAHPGRHRRARRAAARGQLPAPLPALPARHVAALEAAHANAMARTAPHDVRPLARAGATVTALARTLSMTAITAYVLEQWAGKDRPGARPWSEATGTLPAVMAELEEQA